MEILNTVKTTVNEFITWFSGSELWREDPNGDLDITTTMCVNGIHSYADKKCGESFMDILRNSDDREITVVVNDTVKDIGGYETSFVLDEITYSFGCLSIFK